MALFYSSLLVRRTGAQKFQNGCVEREQKIHLEVCLHQRGVGTYQHLRVLMCYLVALKCWEKWGFLLKVLTASLLTLVPRGRDSSVSVLPWPLLQRQCAKPSCSFSKRSSLPWAAHPGRLVALTCLLVASDADGNLQA